MRQYANLNEVAVDFGIYAEEYTAADSRFSQNPRPDNLLIGRWAARRPRPSSMAACCRRPEQLMSTPIPATRRSMSTSRCVRIPRWVASLQSHDGNWDGDPSKYSYQWKRAANNIGTDAPTYTVVDADVGASITCVVTASNILGHVPKRRRPTRW